LSHPERSEGSRAQRSHFTVPGQRIVLLDAIVKKRDDIPPDVLARVRRLNNQVR
jgi:hypothetical protein